MPRPWRPGVRCCSAAAWCPAGRRGPWSLPPVASPGGRWDPHGSLIRLWRRRPLSPPLREVLLLAVLFPGNQHPLTLELLILIPSGGQRRLAIAFDWGTLRSTDLHAGSDDD